ncbi:MAG: GIY-YIG nuclease family protein [Oscillospiraceae bacterium]|nr:GIY-YIG nuclease family protein [Oscillospiraceae bacterium]
MAVRGKSINLYLMDGSADGRIKCTLANWTGIAYRIPRTDIDLCKDREHLKQSGVYFLFGVSDETGEPVVYVGQAGERKNGEGILYRLQEHKKNPDKDYWIEAVVFTTAGNTFGPTEISYLENRFCSIAVEAKRYLVKNANDPAQGHVTEEKESELEEFIDYAKVIMGTLGHKVFTPVNSLVAPADGNSPNVNQQFFLKTSKVDASGKRVSDGFVVLKGSKIALLPTKSCPNWTKQLRTRYQDKIDDSGMLIDDLSFTSPSAAAGFVNYASANGLTSWVTADGRTLKSIESTEE